MEEENIVPTEHVDEVVVVETPVEAVVDAPIVAEEIVASDVVLADVPLAPSVDQRPDILDKGTVIS